ncbi:RelA/SpoT family protein [Ardenticatena maritima]|uniref:RelA/SpoT family protein n=2 Tax=Ardenticatena maritima TaxID=872965 RepID=UPI0009E67318|nr:bifunctional (p)ppGpp synthetase/guanosine-3',5'-bis(diphosphate) 3'-pyrophosphohydrolase [Ardenticatena maritima]
MSEIPVEQEKKRDQQLSEADAQFYAELQLRVDRLKEAVARSFPTYDVSIIQKAYEFAKEAHAQQRRKTGEPYVAHCVATAEILADLRIDPPVVVAGLLHDTVEDTDVTLDDIKREFGDEVARLVDGVTKLSRINELTGYRRRGEEEWVKWKKSGETEYLRKMFLAMAEDVRVILIKLADRLHNMQTLHGLPREKQIRMARETMDIMAPLANRLGIWQIKWQLEDLSFRYLEPDKYEQLQARLNEGHEEREQYIQKVIQQLRARLERAGIKAEITGRPKHLYSIYKKMRRKERDLDQIYDVRAIRIIIDAEDEESAIRDCYTTLGIVHSMWRPIPGEFDDYIANPKENGYKSLHTAVVGPEGKPLEVQIRTREMHYLAEYGVAAHWRYKEEMRQSDRFLEEKIRWLRSLLRQEGEEEQDAEAFMESVRSDVLPDRVLVFTPKGDIKELPAGSTPIDFAYYIHTDVGHRCRGARVNGVIVPLNYQLKDGDQVEIITGKHSRPSRDWLNPHLGYVKTSRARSKIRQWFRKQDRQENITQGRLLLERELKRLGLQHEPFEKLAELAGYENVDDFLAAIGYGDVSPQSVASKALELQRQEQARLKTDEEILEELPAVKPQKPSGSQISVRGVGGLLTRMARCCNPLPGDPIVGYITKGRGVTIHRADCPNIINAREPDRIVQVEWGEDPQQLYQVTIVVRAFDRGGLLRDIVDIVAKENVNLAAANAVTNKRDRSATITATLEIKDAAQLSRILHRINSLPNVLEAYRQSA